MSIKECVEQVANFAFGVASVAFVATTTATVSQASGAPNVSDLATAAVVPAVGAATLAAITFAALQKHGPESRQALDRIRRRVENTLLNDPDITVPETLQVKRCSSLLAEYLGHCTLDRAALAKTIVDARGFPSAATELVLADLARRHSAFEPSGNEIEAPAVAFASAVVAEAFTAAVEDEAWFRKFEPHAILEIARAQGESLEGIRGVSDGVRRLESGVSDTRGDVRALLEHVLEIKSDLHRPLVVQTGFRRLSADQIRRLPTALVVADAGTVPYLDVADQLADLLSWCRNPENVAPAGRLYVAPGGRGKTRLALEAITALRAEGWAAGILPRQVLDDLGGAGRQDFESRLARFISSSDRGACLVIDYAELRIAEVERIARTLLATGTGRPVRMLLLARSDGEWWRGLIDSSRDIELMFEATPCVTLGADLSFGDRVALFDRAAGAFAEELEASERTEDPLVSKDWRQRQRPHARLGRPEANSPLSVTFEAYLHVRGVDARQTPLREMAREERRHWGRALRRSGQTSLLGDLGIEAMHRGAAILTLLQGRGSADTLEVRLDRVVEASLAAKWVEGLGDGPRARRFREVQTALEGLYRHQAEEGEYLSPVRPDILGEHIAATAPGGLSDVLSHVHRFGREEFAHATSVVTRMAAALHDADVRDNAQDALVEALTLDSAASADAIMQALKTPELGIARVLEASVEKIPTQALRQLSWLGNSGSPGTLGTLKLLYDTLALRRDGEENTGNINSITIRAGDSERWSAGEQHKINEPSPEQAAAVMRALDLHNLALVGDDPTVSFARSSEALALILPFVSDGPDFAMLAAKFYAQHIGLAVHAGEEESVRNAVAEGRRLLDLAPQHLSYDRGLTYLILASNVMLALDHQMLEASAREYALSALNATEGMALNGSELEDFSKFYSSSGLAVLREGDPALADYFSGEAVRSAEVCHADDIEEHGQGASLLANALLNRSVVLSALDRGPEALTASERAVALLKQLAARYPEQFKFEYAKALDNICADLGEAGRVDEALACSFEAVDIFEQLGARTDPSGDEDLAAAYLNLAVGLLHSGDLPRATGAYRACDALYERIIDDGRVRFPHMPPILRNVEKALRRANQL